MTYRHLSVMLKEAVDYLNCRSGGTYVDCTLGGAGHSKAILENILPDGLLIGIDRDMDAIRNANEKLKQYKENVRLYHDNFINLPAILKASGVPSVDGILLDLGLSYNQLENSGRGFSFSKDEPLDMRMDSRTSTTAYDIVNSFNERKLSDIFYTFGEERHSKKIARNIVQARSTRPIATSRELAEIVKRSVPAQKTGKKKIHPATQVFMALRIAVNDELENIKTFLGNVVELLNRQGRIVVLSFHSLEDRIVKHWIKDMESDCSCPPQFPKCVCNKKKLFRSVTRKVVIPSGEEIQENPMARSTKMRVAEKM